MTTSFRRGPDALREAAPKRGYRRFLYIDVLKFVRVYQANPREFRMRAAEHFGVDVRTMERHLPKLVQARLLRCESIGSSHLHRYWLSPWGNSLVEKQLAIENGEIPDDDAKWPEELVLETIRHSSAWRN